MSEISQIGRLCANERCNFLVTFEESGGFCCKRCYTNHVRFEVRCVCERGHGEKCEKKEARTTDIPRADPVKPKDPLPAEATSKAAMKLQSYAQLKDLRCKKCKAATPELDEASAKEPFYMKKVVEKQQRRSMAEGPKEPPQPPPGLRSWPDDRQSSSRRPEAQWRQEARRNFSSEDACKEEYSDGCGLKSRRPEARRRREALRKSVSEDEREEEYSDGFVRNSRNGKSMFGEPRMVGGCRARSVAAWSRSRTRSPQSPKPAFGQPRMVSGGGKRPSPPVRGSREACEAAYEVTGESASESGEDSSREPSQKLPRRSADISEGHSSSSKAGSLEKMFDLRFEPGAEARLEEFYEIAERNTARNLEKGKYSVADLRFRARCRARDPHASSSTPGVTVAQSWLVTGCPKKADVEFLVCQVCFSGWEVA
ncbi:unnamed protein product [Symbiodinium sp. CCMP2456]|nr:unnamed protein product [Symbiodinium sp. CCMP2456]